MARHDSDGREDNSRGKRAVTIKEYSRHRGVTRAAIYNAIERGTLTAASWYIALGIKWIVVEDADRELSSNAPKARGVGANMAPPDQGTSGVKVTSTKVDAQTRTESLKADLLELKLERERGLTVSIDDVARVVAAEYANTRQRLLGIASRLAPSIVLVTDPDAVRGLIEIAINEALEELSADTTYMAKYDDQGGDEGGDDEDNDG